MNQGCECKECQTKPHDSDCAVHNEPAEPKGACDCKPMHLYIDLAGSDEPIIRPSRARLTDVKQYLAEQGLVAVPIQDCIAAANTMETRNSEEDDAHYRFIEIDDEQEQG